MVKAAREIPSSMTEIDLATGKKTHKPMSWKMLPPPKDHCQICAKKHPPDQPHDVQQIYYQTAFSGMVGRAATWADAIAHCEEPIKAAWERELRRLGHWSEPSGGEPPVKHHGVE